MSDLHRSSPRWPSACAVGALLPLLGCGPGEPAGGPRPNVLLYVIDTLRADHLEPYGAAAGATPRTADFAAQGAVFEQAYAQAPWTLPSMASLWTSTHLPTHQIHTAGRRIAPGVVTLPGWFQDAGYETVGFTQSVIAGSLIGIERDFDRLREGLEDEARSFFAPAEFPTFLAERDGERPFLAWLHTIEPHVPLDPNRADEARDLGELVRLNRELIEFGVLGSDTRPGTVAREAANRRAEELRHSLRERGQWIRELYAQEVREADLHFGQALEALEAEGLTEGTVVVLTSDHGEELFEHGYQGHRHSLEQELLHVPLLLRAPAESFAGLRVAAPVQSIDIAPTLVELAGGEVPAGWEGRSLLPLLEAQDADRPAPEGAVWSSRLDVQSTDPFVLERWGSTQVARFDGERKWVWTDEHQSAQVYDLDRARPRPGGPRPPEAGEQERWRTDLQRWIEERRARGGLFVERATLDSERAALRALGYAE
jgi:choline-sulfatase